MKIQRADRKIKNKLSPKEYLNIYPSGSSRGNFYGTAQKINLHQLELLTIDPITSNTGTVSYQLAKYLSKSFSPLSKSEYTVANNVEFINNIKLEKKPTVIVLYLLT